MLRKKEHLCNQLNCHQTMTLHHLFRAPLSLLKILPNLYTYIYLTPPHGQDASQGQFLSGE